MQVMQQNQREGIVVNLLPQVTLAVNTSRLFVGLGLEWLVGSVNFGLMKRGFVKTEVERAAHAKREAEKLRITTRQQRLRWGW